MKVQNIDLCSTQELLDELGGRFDHMVFHGWKRLTKDTANRKTRYKGDLFVCQGLCAGLQSEIYNRVRKMEQKDES